jgi:SAM-dependent methyltransferase
MQYEPIKRALGPFLSGPPVIRKIFYLLLDILLLRTWHVKKELKKLAPLTGNNAMVLDAGCGPGQYSWRLSRINKTWKIKGVDIDTVHIDDCKKFFQRTGRADRVSFEVTDLTQMNEKDTYRLIISIDVMEHIADDEKVFSNFHASLKEGGFLLISTPSDKGGSDVHSEHDTSYIDEHVRNGYSIEEIKQKLTAAGFSGITVKYTYGFAGRISWILSMKLPVRLLNISYLFFAVLPFWYLLVMPFVQILNIIDVSFNNREGSGLLVRAKK